jgi:hypothetical protein
MLNEELNHYIVNYNTILRQMSEERQSYISLKAEYENCISSDSKRYIFIKLFNIFNNIKSLNKYRDEYTNQLLNYMNKNKTIVHPIFIENHTKNVLQFEKLYSDFLSNEYGFFIKIKHEKELEEIAT